MSRAPLRVTVSRALRAASRAEAASTTLLITERACWGFSSSQVDNPSFSTFSTAGRTSDETSLSFVCDENFGSGT